MLGGSTLQFRGERQTLEACETPDFLVARIKKLSART